MEKMRIKEKEVRLVIEEVKEALVGVKVIKEVREAMVEVKMVRETMVEVEVVIEVDRMVIREKMSHHKEVRSN